MKASDIPPAGELLQSRAQLRSRMGQVGNAATLADMFNLLAGTGLEVDVMEQARAAVTQFLQNGLTAVEARLAALGIELDQ